VKIKKSPILNFFEMPSNFDKLPSNKDNVQIRCKVCDKQLLFPFSKTTNLMKHLRCDMETNGKLRGWLKKYQIYTKSSLNSDLNKEDFDLIKYFITSNSCLVELENPHFRNLLSFKVNIN